MFAHRTKGTVLGQKLIYTFRVEYMPARKLSDDSYSVFIIGEADMTTGLKVGSSVVTGGSNARSLASNTNA
jgi:hypothetical protein